MDESYAGSDSGAVPSTSGDLRDRTEAHTFEERVRMAHDEQKSKDRARKLRKRGEDRQAVQIIERRAIRSDGSGLTPRSR